MPRLTLSLIVGILALVGGVAVMAAPKQTPNYDPMKQVPTPGGKLKEQGSEPTDGEMAEWMWRRFAGDKPMPPELRKKYGLPPEQAPLPAGR